MLSLLDRIQNTSHCMPNSSLFLVYWDRSGIVFREREEAKKQGRKKERKKKKRRHGPSRDIPSRYLLYSLFHVPRTPDQILPDKSALPVESKEPV